MKSGGRFPAPTLPNQEPIAQGTLAPDGVPTAFAVPVDMPPAAVPTFELQLPPGMGPGTQFPFMVEGRQCMMIVPEGARPGQVLRCMLVPFGVAPGSVRALHL